MCLSRPFSKSAKVIWKFAKYSYISLFNVLVLFTHLPRIVLQVNYMLLNIMKIFESYLKMLQSVSTPKLPSACFCYFAEFKERFEDAMEKYNIDCPCIAKVFVIIPKSCSFPAPGTQFEREVHIGPLEPVVLGFRKFFLQLYKITTSKGQVKMLIDN